MAAIQEEHGVDGLKDNKYEFILIYTNFKKPRNERLLELSSSGPLFIQKWGDYFRGIIYLKESMLDKIISLH